MRDLVLDKDYAEGSKGQKVKLIQEWLCLHGINIACESKFGPVTDYAVREFQKRRGLKVNGMVDDKTFAKLTGPMREAVKPLSVDRAPLGRVLVRYAKQHLRQHPVELGGQNKGPWVRLYMEGHEGASWPWCAGFACFILKQACETLSVSLPIATSFSCDFLAASAKEKGIFLQESQISKKKQIAPGSFFLNRRTSTDWVHTGIVLKAEESYFHTIEGNTNDEGSREGYEVCRRTRGYKKKDFVLI
ncbi:MAG: peptidoglycan-binding domain-containing protein [Thermodesulfobacteriota bacterium]|nr:peptidoglycan-binding domain-containing protein [Thermodesulfobacteriota bacterium]